MDSNLASFPSMAAVQATIPGLTAPLIIKSSERTVVRNTVDKLLSCGYRLSVDDGETILLEKSRDSEKILSKLYACQEEDLRVYPPDSGAFIGRVSFVYGRGVKNVIAFCSKALREELESPRERT